MRVARFGLWAPALADCVLRTTNYTRYFEINDLMILASKCLTCITHLVSSILKIRLEHFPIYAV